MGLENMGSGLPIITWQGCLVATGPETTLLLEAKKKMKTQVTKSTENVFSQSLYSQLLDDLYTSGTGVPGKSRDPHPQPTRKLPKQRYQHLLKGQCPTVSALLNVGMLKWRLLCSCRRH